MEGNIPGRFVRPLNFKWEDLTAKDSSESDENDSLEIVESEAQSSEAAGSSSSGFKLNPLHLIDSFPEDPSMEAAREFWVDWINMLKKMFAWNTKTIRNDEARMSILMTKGGSFIRQILAEKLDGLNFKEAENLINDYLCANTNAAIDRATFQKIKQEDGESFQKFVDRVQKKARVFKFVDKGRVMDQIIAGATATDKITEYTIGKEVTLKEIIIYGNQLEAFEPKQESNIIRREVNEIKMTQSNRFKPYDVSRPRKAFSNKEATACYYCGRMHPPRKCPAMGKTCSSCGKINHFARVCKSRVKNTESDQVKVEENKM
jgi:hypothetical protein